MHVKRILTCNQGRGWMFLGFQKEIKNHLISNVLASLFQKTWYLWSLSLQGCMCQPYHLPYPQDAQAQSNRCPPICLSFSQRTWGSTLTSVSASTALSSNSVMVFLTPSWTCIPMFCTTGSESSTGRRVMWKVWVTYNGRECRWDTCPWHPPKWKGALLSLSPFLAWLTDQKPKRELSLASIPGAVRNYLNPCLRAGENETRITLVTVHTPFMEDCAESTPTQDGNQGPHLPHWLRLTA